MDITIIGAAILDVLAQPVDREVFETGSWPVEDLQMNIGGDGANEALVLAGLGKRVQLQTVLGPDLAGRMILARLRERGVYIEDSCVQEDMVTGINTVLIQKDGERCFLTNPKGSLRRLSLEHIRMPFPRDTRILCLASIFVSPLLGVKELETIFAQAKKQDHSLRGPYQEEEWGDSQGYGAGSSLYRLSSAKRGGGKAAHRREDGGRGGQSPAGMRRHPCGGQVREQGLLCAGGEDRILDPAGTSGELHRYHRGGGQLRGRLSRGSPGRQRHPGMRPVCQSVRRESGKLRGGSKLAGINLDKPHLRVLSWKKGTPRFY